MKKQKTFQNVLNIFGKFLTVLDRPKKVLKNFSGTYKVINSKLFIDNIRINDKLLDLRINLSKYCE